MEKEHQNKFPSSYTIPMRKGISVSCVWVVCWGHIYSDTQQLFFFLSGIMVRSKKRGEWFCEYHQLPKEKKKPPDL